MGYILEQFATWISDAIGAMLNLVTALFADIIKPDLTLMNQMFPELARLLVVMQVIGVAFALLILLFQLLRIMMGQLSDNSESIIKLAVRTLFFIFLIYYAKDLMDIIIGVATEPYNFMATTNTIADASKIDFTQVSTSIKGMGTDVATNSGVNLTKMPFDGGILVNIIIMVMIAWNYIKLMIEIVERYLIMGVMAYTSPLALATGGSEATSNIFSSWCKMFGAQLILMILNVWFLRIVNSGIGTICGLYVVDGLNPLVSTTGKTLALIGVACMLRIAQRMDTYLSALGVNVAQTGQGLSSDIAATAIAVKGMASGISSGLFGGKGGLSSAMGSALSGGKGIGATGAEKAWMRGASKTNGGIDAMATGMANARQMSGNTNQEDKVGAMSLMNSKGAKNIDGNKQNAFMQNVMGTQKKGALQGAGTNQNASGMANSKGMFNSKQTIANGGIVGAPIGGVNPLGLNTPIGGKASQVLGGTSIGNANNPLSAIANGGRTSEVGSFTNGKSFEAGKDYDMNKLDVGDGKMVGNMTLANGTATDFAITSSPNEKTARIDEMADGSLACWEFSNPEAVQEISGFGRGAYDIGDSAQAFTTYTGDEAERIMDTMKGFDSSGYDEISIGNDGQTLLHRDDNSGYDEIMPIGAVSGDYDSVPKFMGDDNQTYGVQAYSGNGFSYLTDDMVDNNTYFTGDSPVVNAINEHYDLKTAPINNAELHYDADNQLDYITVVDDDGGMARIMDQSLVEADGEYGGLAVIASKSDEEGNAMCENAFIQHANGDGTFNGRGVVSKKRLWFQKD